MQSLSFIPLKASAKEVSFFRKFSLSDTMATNQNQRFGQNSYGWWRITMKHFCKTLFSKYLQ